MVRVFIKLLNSDEPDTFLTINTKLQQKKPENSPKNKTALKDLRNHKVSGENKVFAEMLKYAGTTIHTSQHLILKTIWNTEKLPEEWTMAIINPLHKKRA